MTKWKRGLVVSCSHAEMVLPDAMPTLCALCKDWKPDHLVHLGDFLDTTAFRSGAAGTPDESADVGCDIEAGLSFVNEFFSLSPRAKVRLLFKGNHDNRPFKLARHPSAIVRHAAKDVCDAIEYTARKCKAELVPYDIRDGWRAVADDMLCGHGYMYNEHAVRDHAQMLGRSVIMGHLHRDEVRRAPTLNRAIGYCIGWLGDERKAGYARERKATLAWENSFCIYETNGMESVVWQQKRTSEGWRTMLPASSSAR